MPSGGLAADPVRPASGGTGRSISRCARRTRTWNGAGSGSPSSTASIARLAASACAAVTT